MLRSFTVLGLVVLAGLVFGVSSFAAGGNSTTCTSSLAPGDYGRVVVPAGAVCINGADVTIRGGLYVEEGATFVFGDEESPTINATITGGVHATNADSVQIHFSTISGGVDVHGGAGPDGGPFDITWNTFEDNHINGSVTIDGYDGFWQGFFRNTVNGAVNFDNNTVVDPDGNELQTNTIHGSLNCSGNTPAPQQGDSEGSPNSVTGAKTGQCAGL